MFKVIWLTGGSGVGKTTVANLIQNSFPCLVLDGDGMRSSICLGLGFSDEDRTENNLRVARLSRELVKQMNIVVASIAPIKAVRGEIDKICSPIWIYVHRSLPVKDGHFYEPSTYYFTVDHDKLSIKESVEKILKHLSL